MGAPTVGLSLAEQRELAGYAFPTWNWQDDDTLLLNGWHIGNQRAFVHDAATPKTLRVEHSCACRGVAQEKQFDDMAHFWRWIGEQRRDKATEASPDADRDGEVRGSAV